MTPSDEVLKMNPEYARLIGADNGNADLASKSDGLARVTHGSGRAESESTFQSKVKSKYNAIPTVYETIYGPVRFPSKKEAAEAQKIDLLSRAGEIKSYLMQVPFKLPGGVVHRVDFGIINLDGTVTWREAKGKDLGMGKLKRRQTQELYHIVIEVV